MQSLGSGFELFSSLAVDPRHAAWNTFWSRWYLLIQTYWEFGVSWVIWNRFPPITVTHAYIWIVLLDPWLSEKTSSSSRKQEMQNESSVLIPADFAKKCTCPLEKELWMSLLNSLWRWCLVSLMPRTVMNSVGLGNFAIASVEELFS